MGTWGPGNFDNDAARDHLFDLTRGLADDIEESFELATRLTLAGPDPHGDLTTALETVLPNIDILCVLHESLEGGFLPELETVDEWQSRFESLSPECRATGEESAARCSVIQAAFARLRQFAQQCWEE